MIGHMERGHRAVWEQAGGYGNDETESGGSSSQFGHGGDSLG